MMRRQKHIKWNKLDNAAKLFPCTSNKRDTKVFRFACEFTEPVEPDLLQNAMELTLEIFPFYRSVLKRGLFWYYFERSTIKTEVKSEKNPPCSPIYDRNVKGLLFEISYFQKRINVEIYHALTDGTGALQFLRVLVYQYLILRHSDAFAEHMPEMDYQASLWEKEDDSFQKYFSEKKKRDKKKICAYHIKGQKEAESRIKIIEGILSVNEVLQKAHDYHTTLTVFLTAVFMCAIAKQMTAVDKKRPVVLQIPVNLRNYFESGSARNFFGLIHASYDFGTQSEQIDHVIAYLSGFFKQELTAEKLGLRQSGFTTLEHNFFARATPLFLKDIFMRFAARLADRESTGSISNIGKVSMPQEMGKYIRLFDVFVSTDKKQICLCSFKDNLTISFTSAFISSEVEKNFFRMLTDMGLSVELVTNKIDEE